VKKQRGMRVRNMKGVTKVLPREEKGY